MSKIYKVLLSSIDFPINLAPSTLNLFDEQIRVSIDDLEIMLLTADAPPTPSEHFERFKYKRFKFYIFLPPSAPKGLFDKFKAFTADVSLIDLAITTHDYLLIFEAERLTLMNSLNRVEKPVIFSLLIERLESLISINYIGEDY